ncbi:hypothetical protein Avbf_19066 [Armadillidium vulgare]|nr:hypothetical protein Avbf_19066 [Armadillidium vulgare]
MFLVNCIFQISEIFKNMDENFKIDDFDNLSPGYGPCCLCYKVCRTRQHLKGTHKIKNDGFLNILVSLIKFMGLQIRSKHALEKRYSICKVCGSLVKNCRIKNHLRKEHLFNDVISREKTFLSMKKFFSNNTSNSKIDTTDAEQKIAEEIYFNEINGKGSEDKNFKQAEKEIYCYLNFLWERNFTLKQCSGETAQDQKDIWFRLHPYDRKNLQVNASLQAIFPSRKRG